MPTLENEIKSIIKGDIAADSQTLRKYSHDASLFEIMPRLVVFPKDSEDVQALVRFVHTEKQKGRDISIAPRSGGTDMTGGPLSESIVMDFTRYMNKLLDLTGNYATVQPGMYYRDFEKETLKKNKLLPSFPASREIAAVGGMVGNNSGGEKTLQYGKTEKYVEQLKIVLEDGNEYTIKPLSSSELEQMLQRDDYEGRFYRKIYRLIENNKELLEQAKPKVSKNSSGYYLWNVWNGQTFDLNKLFVGSQGTLGIITEIKFRLIEPKKYSKILVVFVDDFKDFPKLIHAVLDKKPETFEAFDDHTFKIAVKYFREFVSQMKTGILKLAWQFLPEVWMLISGGIPKYVFLAEFTGDSKEEVEARAEDAEKSLHHLGLRTRLTKNDQEAKKYQTIRRESYNLLRHKITDRRPAPFIDDIIVSPDALPDFLPEVQKILDEYEQYMVYTVVGHVGDGNFHIIPLMDLKDEKVRDVIPEMMDKVYDLVFKYKGSMSAEHNDGLIRGPYLEKMFGQKVYSLFQLTKQIFDGENIFNPGKKVSVSAQYAFDHFKTDLPTGQAGLPVTAARPVGSKRLKLAGGIAVAAFALSGALFIGNNTFMNNDFEQVRIGQTEVKVQLASNSLTRAKGLSGRDRLSSDEGMLFIFDTPTVPNFWMKDMNFPIDIIWIDENKKIVDIAANVSPDTYPDYFRPSQPVKYVLEVNAGFVESNNINLGDHLTYDFR